LKKAEYKKKTWYLGATWFTVKNLMDRISICESWLKRNEIKLFFNGSLRAMKNGSRMTIIYEKDQKQVIKARWSFANGEKARIDAKKNYAVCSGKGIIHYELLPSQPIDSTINNWKDYTKQSRESNHNWSIGKSSSSITPDPTSLATRQKLKELGWKVLMHPSYNPDFAPSDYHLFWSLQNSLNDVKLTSKGIVKITCRSFLSKNHRSSTVVLPQKWQKMNKTHIWRTFGLINFI